MKWMLTAALCGMLIGDSLAEEEAPASTPLPVLKSENGRYVFGQTGQTMRNTWMLDTLTGRLWQIIGDSKTGATYLSPVPYVALKTGLQSLEPPKTESEMEAARQAEVQLKAQPGTTPAPVVQPKVAPAPILQVK